VETGEGRSQEELTGKGWADTDQTLGRKIWHREDKKNEPVVERKAADAIGVAAAPPLHNILVIVSILCIVSL
jgi:hypothetical protein